MLESIFFVQNMELSLKNRLGSENVELSHMSLDSRQNKNNKKIPATFSVLKDAPATFSVLEDAPATFSVFVFFSQNYFK